MTTTNTPQEREAIESAIAAIQAGDLIGAASFLQTLLEAAQAADEPPPPPMTEEELRREVAALSAQVDAMWRERQPGTLS